MIKSAELIEMIETINHASCHPDWFLFLLRKSKNRTVLKSLNKWSENLVEVEESVNVCDGFNCKSCFMGYHGRCEAYESDNQMSLEITHVPCNMIFSIRKAWRKDRDIFKKLIKLKDHLDSQVVKQ